MNVIRQSLNFLFNVVVCKGFEDFDFTVPRTGTIDIWWLADDGGLTLLLAYLISQCVQPCSRAVGGVQLPHWACGWQRRCGVVAERRGRWPVVVWRWLFAVCEGCRGSRQRLLGRHGHC